MEAFQERTVNEYKELSTRVLKLEDFIFDPLFDKLNKEEKISTNPTTDRDEKYILGLFY